LAQGGGDWSALQPGHFTPRKSPLPMEQKAGWTPQLIWELGGEIW